MKLRHNLVLILMAMITLAITSNAMQRTKGMTILKFMQEENKAVVQTADDKAKALIEKFVTNITKEDTDALCTILLDTIKLDDKAIQYLTNELCTKLLFLTLEHNKPLTFKNLLRLTFVTNITKEGTDAFCTILLDTIKLDTKAMQYLTNELCIKLLFLALEHNKPLTFKNLLRLDNTDPNAIDPLTGHTLTYMTVKFNNPDCLALLAVAYHAKLSYTPKTYHLTPLQLAKSMGYKQCELILIAADAKE